MKIKAWIKAFRLRTLPLALAGIILGGMLAYSDHFDWTVFILAILTTVFLQVLSNLANDYGDFKKGTDDENRVGPQRAMQAGLINESQMKIALIANVILCLAAGIPLVLLGLKGINWWAIIFILVGIAGIGAAIKYTIGKKAFAYTGLGDVFVFLFFGLVSVNGVYFLLSKEFDFGVAIASVGVGALSTTVLNLNNLRDHVNDKLHGKHTIVVKMGFQKAKIYHVILCIVPFITSTVFMVISQKQYVALSLIIAPVIIMHLKKVLSNEDPRLLDPELKKMALTTLLYCVTFGLGFLIT